MVLFSTLDTSIVDNVTFNIGVIGFKMVVNEGSTIFNLVDGVVDEFNSESGPRYFRKHKYDI